MPGLLCPPFFTCLTPPDLHTSTDSLPRSLLWPFARPNHPIKILLLSGLPFPPQDLLKLQFKKRVTVGWLPRCMCMCQIQDGCKFFDVLLLARWSLIPLETRLVLGTRVTNRMWRERVSGSSVGSCCWDTWNIHSWEAPSGNPAITLREAQGTCDSSG